MSRQATEQLTLFQEDFPASLFPWLESKKEKKTTVTYGRKCSELSENLRRVGLSVRTYLESCVLPGEQFARTWSVRDTLSPYLILKLRLSERHTDENGCSLWVGTPQAANANHNVRSEKFQSKTLNPVEFVQMWPTPTSGRADQEMSPSQENRHTLNLAQIVQIRAGLWPTPTTRDYKDGSAESCKNVPVNGLLGRAVHMWPTPTSMDACGLDKKLRADATSTRSILLSQKVAMFPTPRAQSATGVSNAPNRQGAPDLQSVAGGQLNPTWVEWLMGFPIGWTDLNALETP